MEKINWSVNGTKTAQNINMAKGNRINSKYLKCQNLYKIIWKIYKLKEPISIRLLKKKNGSIKTR